jgi:hypothetical protein
MDDKEEGHLAAAFKWLNRVGSGLDGGNPSSVIRTFLTIEKALRAIEDAGRARGHSMADFVRCLASLLTGYNLDTTQLGRPPDGVFDAVKKAVRIQIIGRRMNNAPRDMRGTVCRQLEKEFDISRTAVYDDWDIWKKQKSKELSGRIMNGSL